MEARAKIFSQLDRYRRWLQRDRRTNEVIEAYRATAGALVALSDGLRKHGIKDLPALDPSFRALAGGSPRLIERPGIAIEVDDAKGPAALRSFESAKPFGHRARIEKDGYCVEIVGAGRGNGVLPLLS